MKLLTDFKTIVIVGGWNKHIFNPEWVKDYIFPKDDFSVEFPLNIDGSPRFSTKKFRISIEQNRLNFFSRTDKDEHLNDLQDLAMKIGDYFPHTPVSSLGQNFIYGEKENLEEVDSVLKCKFVDKLSKIDIGTVATSEIKKKIKLDHGELNLSIRRDKKSYTFDFNHHFDIKRLTDIKEKLVEYPLIDTKKKTIDLISQLFDITPENE